MNLHASFFWRKLDHPGHDSCRLFKLPKGWFLSGAAVFSDNDKPCHLIYEVAADTGWKTRRAKISGFIGNGAVDLRIRAAGRQRWFVNGVEKDIVAGCMDLDLGFTPATNLIAIRRLALKVGQRAEAPAAYLAFPKMRLEMLEQTYHRTGRTTFEYTAPHFGYADTLEVGPSGAVVAYPGLFEQVLPGEKREQASAA
jgi:uncharacterized protein